MKSQKELYKCTNEAFEEFVYVDSKVLQDDFESSVLNFWSTYGNNDINVIVDFEDNR